MLFLVFRDGILNCFKNNIKDKINKQLCSGLFGEFDIIFKETHYGKTTRHFNVRARNNVIVIPLTRKKFKTPRKLSLSLFACRT